MISGYISGVDNYIVSEGQNHWKIKPKHFNFSGRKEDDMQGRTFGTLTVIGCYASHKKKGMQWLVRCACGIYETRYARSIKNRLNQNDKCNYCRKLDITKSIYERNKNFKETGYYEEQIKEGI